MASFWNELVPRHWETVWGGTDGTTGGKIFAFPSFAFFRMRPQASTADLSLPRLCSGGALAPRASPGLEGPGGHWHVVPEDFCTARLDEQDDFSDCSAQTQTAGVCASVGGLCTSRTTRRSRLANQC